MIAFDYIEPATVGETVGLLERHGDDAHLIAGGTSVVLMLKQQLISPGVLIGLRRAGVPTGIRTIPDGCVEIGAMARHRDVERSATIAAYADGLAEAFGHIATVRIRNQGTIGGNLAHADPAQDPPPVLLALDATVQIAGTDGARSVPISSLFVDYYETSLTPSDVITSVQLPPRPANAQVVYLKYLPRSQDDYATVGVAASATTASGQWTDVRIALGAAGPVPMRIDAAEAALEGLEVGDAAALRRAAELVGQGVDPITDVRGSADYKREMAMVWTQRALQRLASRHFEEVRGD